MQHLRESGQLEQDADIIMMIYRKPTMDDPNLRGLKIAKNKDGPIGKTFLHFDAPRQRFRQSYVDPDHRNVKPEKCSPAGMAYKQVEIPDGEVPF